MSTVSSIVEQVRSLAAKPFVSRDNDMPFVAKCIRFIRTRAGFTLYVDCSVKGRKYSQAVRGNIRSVEETVAEALRLRHNMQRRGNAAGSFNDRAKAAIMAGKPTRASYERVSDKPLPEPTYIVVGDYDKPKPKASTAKTLPTLSPLEIGRLIAIGLSSLAGGIVGYILGRSL